MYPREKSVYAVRRAGSAVFYQNFTEQHRGFDIARIFINMSTLGRKTQRNTHLKFVSTRITHSTTTDLL